MARRLVAAALLLLIRGDDGGRCHIEVVVDGAARRLETSVPPPERPELVAGARDFAEDLGLATGAGCDTVGCVAERLADMLGARCAADEYRRRSRRSRGRHGAVPAGAGPRGAPPLQGPGPRGTSRAPRSPSPTRSPAPSTFAWTCRAYAYLEAWARDAAPRDAAGRLLVDAAPAAPAWDDGSAARALRWPLTGWRRRCLGDAYAAALRYATLGVDGQGPGSAAFGPWSSHDDKRPPRVFLDAAVRPRAARRRPGGGPARLRRRALRAVLRACDVLASPFYFRAAPLMAASPAAPRATLAPLVT
ncbi:hypothetical protein JL720_16356 [Aureococcus anophagefferens]|nr:hypothetical protein JL720_16356 [Aureococcus anophagefferens]